MPKAKDEKNDYEAYHKAWEIVKDIKPEYRESYIKLIKFVFLGER